MVSSVYAPTTTLQEIPIPTITPKPSLPLSEPLDLPEQSQVNQTLIDEIERQGPSQINHTLVQELNAEQANNTRMIQQLGCNSGGMESSIAVRNECLRIINTMDELFSDIVSAENGYIQERDATRPPPELREECIIQDIFYNVTCAQELQ
jgi:hypothetical protein